MRYIKSAIVAGACAVPLLFLSSHGARGNSVAVSAPSPAIVQPAAFAQCKTCHSVDRGGKPGIGPNLFAIGDKVAGTKPGYVYSRAMRGSRKRWDRANLDAYLKDPRGLIPGTKMMAPGVTDARKRKEIVDYLMVLK